MGIYNGLLYSYQDLFWEGTIDAENPDNIQPTEPSSPYDSQNPAGVVLVSNLVPGNLYMITTNVGYDNYISFPTCDAYYPDEWSEDPPVKLIWFTGFHIHSIKEGNDSNNNGWLPYFPWDYALYQGWGCQGFGTPLAHAWAIASNETVYAATYDSAVPYIEANPQNILYPEVYYTAQSDGLLKIFAGGWPMFPWGSGDCATGPFTGLLGIKIYNAMVTSTSGGSPVVTWLD